MKLLATVGGFANHVSSVRSGNPTNRQGELASMVHAKACAHARSIGAIVQSSMFDHSAIVSLARMIIDCHTMYAYLVEPTTDEEWVLRHLVLRLHDTASRIKLMRAWQEKKDYADLTAGRDDLVKSIERSSAFGLIDEERRRRLVTGEEIFVGGMRRAAAVAGWDSERFTALYGYFSAHIHGAPMSFIRTRDHGIDFIRPSDTQHRIAAFAVEVAAAALRRMTLQHLGDYPCQADPLLAATVDGIRQDDATSQVFR